MNQGTPFDHYGLPIESKMDHARLILGDPCPKKGLRGPFNVHIGQFLAPVLLAKPGALEGVSVSEFVSTWVPGIFLQASDLEYNTLSGEIQDGSPLVAIYQGKKFYT